MLFELSQPTTEIEVIWAYRVRNCTPPPQDKLHEPNSPHSAHAAQATLLLQGCTSDLGPGQPGIPGTPKLQTRVRVWENTN